MSEQIQIEVAYAKPEQQKVIPLTVAAGTSIKEAIIQSGILHDFPEINLTEHQVGIFSRICQLGEQVKEGDRIEIYRPLAQDPKELRKQRAKK